MNNEEVRIKILEIHHQQLAVKGQQIIKITERIVAVMFLVTGWIVLSDSTPSANVRTVLAVSILVISVTGCYFLYRLVRSYKEVATVVTKLSTSLGMFENDKFIQGDALYPKRWLEFGTARAQTFIHYWIIILLMSMLCLGALLSKQ